MGGGIDVAAILVISLLQLSLRGASSAGHRHPLVIVPGILASKIYARLTQDYRPSVGDVCGAHRPAGWFRLWKNDRLMREPLLQCFTEQIAIHYDAGLDDYRNTPGVETVAPHFGSVEGFRHPNPEDLEDSPEMSMLLGRLEAIGYRDGEDLLGAPYDFRYGLAAPGHPSRVGSEFLHNLRDLVEHAATANGGKRVVIVAYSMGGLYVLQLLNRNPPSWRRRFVKHFIAIAVPWGGMHVAYRGLNLRALRCGAGGAVSAENYRDGGDLRERGVAPSFAEGLREETPGGDVPPELLGGGLAAVARGRRVPGGGAPLQVSDLAPGQPVGAAGGPGHLHTGNRDSNARGSGVWTRLRARSGGCVGGRGWSGELGELAGGGGEVGGLGCGAADEGDKGGERDAWIDTGGGCNLEGDHGPSLL